MSFILNIDTATEVACISLGNKGNIVAEIYNREQKEHGSFLQPAINSLLEQTGFTFANIDAIAVSAGPGSYTGLRVGMASAKGLSFALDKPLLTIGTLEILACAIALQMTPHDSNVETLICPMIDARRLEVFTALYDRSLNVILPPCAMVLSKDAFANWLLKYKVVFCGSGSNKWKSMVTHPNAVFPHSGNNSLAMSFLSCQKYLNKSFADIAYAEPTYLKEFFHTGLSK
jgi:tRNA threonylcarbamoyladenosine biosynthesis protein TsaB